MNSSVKIAAVFAGIGVAIGAFGAHALKDFLIQQDKLATFETAVQYHFIHALGLLAVGILREKKDGIWLRRTSFAFISGIIIFSGSLYVLCISGYTILGAITPIGGVAFIIGWASLFYSAIKK